MNLFEVNGLVAGYGKAEVLSRVDLSIKQGEFVTVIGPNGTGKSTLLRVLAGYIRPAKGSVKFMGEDVSTYGRRRLSREFSFVQSNLENIQPFTVFDFAAMGLFPHRKFLDPAGAEGSVLEALELTGISHLKHRPITELSEGERQLACLAQALVQNRTVILLDEPVTHLDIRHTSEIMNILHMLNRSGSTIISILHDINLASDYSTRIIGIKDGSIYFDGAPEAVIKYDLIEKLFGTVCVVTKNPISGRPFAYAVPAHIK